MTHPKPFPLLANRILRKAARAEQAIVKHKQRMTQGLEAYAKAALREEQERAGYDTVFSAPMSFNGVFAAAADERELLMTAVANLRNSDSPWTVEALQSELENMAPLLFGGWVPSLEQRRTAEHFSTTGDVFDLLGLDPKAGDHA